MQRKLIICASPRRKGRSVLLTELLVEAERAAEPKNIFDVFFLAEHFIEGCTACDACEEDFSCIIDDDMQLLYPLLNEADELTIVSPVFFAGPPSQYKALLDRMQPYFWRNLKVGPQRKRPAKLFVLGEGGDPHGFAPLVISTRSALAVAGFSLDAVYDARRLTDEGLKKIARDPEHYKVEGEAFNSPTPPGFSGETHA